MCDVELISNYTCPVCHKQCGRSQSNRHKRRHSLVMHLRRGKEKDLQHAVWTAAHYRKHFPIGRTQPKVVALSVNQVEKIIRQHCGDQINGTSTTICMQLKPILMVRAGTQHRLKC
jgi:hypothetical protein